MGIRMQITSRGFTIMELMVIIAVLGILAGLGTVGYGAWQKRVNEDALKSDLLQASAQLKNELTWNNSYPATESAANGGKGLPKSDGTTYNYVRDAIADTYCITASSDKPGTSTYMITSEDTVPREGSCGSVIVDGSAMQVMNAGNCPTTRARAVDARDNRTYWVQKLADDKCWMLTNLAYAGGGTNTYGDVKSLVDGTDDAAVNFEPRYIVLTPGPQYTVEPTNPSTATNGSGQYGYLYNWCAALGGQPEACNDTVSPLPSAAISICPAGWRLPTGNSGGELQQLSAALGGTTAALQTDWLAQRSGYWFGTSFYQGARGYYWSSSQHSGTRAHNLEFTSSHVAPVSNNEKDYSLAVRCVAN